MIGPDNGCRLFGAKPLSLAALGESLTDARLLFIGLFGTNFNEIWFKTLPLKRNGFENVACKMAATSSPPQCCNEIIIVHVMQSQDTKLSSEPKFKNNEVIKSNYQYYGWMQKMPNSNSLAMKSRLFCGKPPSGILLKISNTDKEKPINMPKKTSRADTPAHCLLCNISNTNVISNS